MSQSGANTVHTASHGPKHTATKLCGLFIGETLDAHQEQGFPSIRRQFHQRPLEVLQIKTSLLVWNRDKPSGVGAVCILDLAHPLAAVRIESMPQDGEEPRTEVGASLEAVHLRPRSDEGVLNQQKICVTLFTANHEAICDAWNQQQEVSMTLKILRLISIPKVPHWLETLLIIRQPVPVRLAGRPHSASVFRSLAVTCVLGCVATFGPLSAHAQVLCASREKLVEVLSDQYKESPVGIGLAQSGQVLEVFASSSGSWSMVMTATDGKTCIIATGDNWEMISKVKGTGI
jgi:hypothetical protein